jgi:hypothetical protein
VRTISSQATASPAIQRRTSIATTWTSSTRYSPELLDETDFAGSLGASRLQLSELLTAKDAKKIRKGRKAKRKTRHSLAKCRQDIGVKNVENDVENRAKRDFETPQPHAAVLKLLILRDLGLVCGRTKICPTRQYADVDAKVLARKFM